MSIGGEKGVLSSQLSIWEMAAGRLRKTVRYYKHEEETNFWIVCHFCSYFVLLLVDITFSAQQECILPFSHNSSSSFLLPDLVSILDLVKKKRLFSVASWKLIYKGRIETQNVSVGEERRKKEPWRSTVRRKFKCWMTTCKNKIKQSLS